MSHPPRRYTPFPCASLFRSSVTVNVALRDPVTVGVKVTLMVQVPLAAKVEGLRGQLFVCPKSPGLVPVRPMVLMANLQSQSNHVGTPLPEIEEPKLWFTKDN